MKTSYTALGLVLFAGACSPEPPPFILTGDVSDVMLGVVEPGAETYWDAVGTILDSTGVTEIRPEGDEEWEAVRNAAYTVAESGNLLMMEGRALDDGAWNAFARAMTQAALRAVEAAEMRDETAVFDRGAELYYACTACHEAYALETLRPNFDVDTTGSNGS